MSRSCNLAANTEYLRVTGIDFGSHNWPLGNPNGGRLKKSWAKTLQKKMVEITLGQKRQNGGGLHPTVEFE